MQPHFPYLMRMPLFLVFVRNNLCLAQEILSLQLWFHEKNHWQWCITWFDNFSYTSFVEITKWMRLFGCYIHQASFSLPLLGSGRLLKCISTGAMEKHLQLELWIWFYFHLLHLLEGKKLCDVFFPALLCIDNCSCLAFLCNSLQRLPSTMLIYFFFLWSSCTKDTSTESSYICSFKQLWNLVQVVRNCVWPSRQGLSCANLHNFIGIKQCIAFFQLLGNQFLEYLSVSVFLGLARGIMERCFGSF